MPSGATSKLSCPVSGRPAIPVVEQRRVATPASECERLAGLARKLLRDDPSLGRTDIFGPLVSAGLTEGPAALIGDQREIGLHEAQPAQALEFRIALLAGEGDILVVERDCPAHERYLKDLLGLDDLRVIALDPPKPGKPAPIASRCCDSEIILSQFVAAAREGGRFQIVPHIGAGSAWAFAAKIARESGVSVTVAAPPPRLTSRVNDKIWFANRIREVLGPDSLPPTFAAFGPAAIAAKIAYVARSSEKIIVKTPDSSGSMGNVALSSTLVRGLDLGRIRGLVLSLLRARGWRGRFPLLVGVWEGGAVASPSVQLWIPRPDQGGPIIEGLFEQHLAGPGAEFVGAVPARLPEPIADRLAGEAMRLATLFQYLGFFGRCSFDCLVTGSLGGKASLHWIECNGRWGGVSVPMTFANRMFGNHAERGLVIVQNMDLLLSATGVTPAFERLGELLLRPGRDQGVVPLSVGGFDRGRGVHFLSVAATQGRAEELASAALARMTASR
jgi:hypothetical protein